MSKRRHTGLLLSLASSLAFVLLASSPGVSHPRDPVRQCAAAKLKAVARATTAAAKCHQAAILKGLGVDPACLAKAASKLAEAIDKADRGGMCAGAASALAAAADRCVAASLAEVQPVTTTTAASLRAWASPATAGREDASPRAVR